VCCGELGNGDCAFIEYSPGNIKLKRCCHCHGVVDKYVEYQTTLVGMDVLLHKIEAMRHILFNMPGTEDRIKIAVVYNMLIEFYIRMYYQGNQNSQALPMLVESLVSSLLAILVAFIVLFMLVDSERVGFDYPNRARTLISALSLGSSVKSLFVIMSIWTYPVHFILVLRILALSCTAMSLKAILRKASYGLVCGLALVICICQTLHVKGLLHM